MRLADAVICVNCDTIFEYSSVCPACAATQQLTPLSTWIPAIYKPSYTKIRKQTQTNMNPYVLVCLSVVCGSVLAEALWLLAM